MTKRLDTDPTGGSHAVVLGGGGISGIAWEAALLAGLIHAGIPVEDADAFGTSAGSVVATLLKSGRLRPEALGALMATPLERADDEGAEADAFDALAFTDMKTGLARGAKDDTEARARLGRHAIETPVSIREERWIGSIGAMLPDDWPGGRIGVTAVDATDGSFHVFEKGHGVPLATAVAASCTVPTVYPLVTIDGRKFMDGGMRSTTNADVARGYDRVLVIACSDESPATAYGPTQDDAIAALRADAEVFVVTPDAATTEIFARNILDPANSEPSALAGWAQAEAMASDIAAFWRG